jgi:putative transposase
LETGVGPPWQRCRVHFMRDALAHAGKSDRRVVSAFIPTAFAQDDAEAARSHWRRIADQLRPKLPKLAAFLDEAQTDVLAYMSFPAAHRAKLHSTDPLERVNGEIKRRTEVVSIFPNEDAITRLVHDPPRTERRMGRSARSLHDPGNDRAPGR